MRFTLKTYRIIVPDKHMKRGALADLPAVQTDDEFEAWLEERGFVKQQ